MILDPTAPLAQQLRAESLYDHRPGCSALLYRFRDEAGSLLYIGVTVNPGIRWQAHRNTAAWWDRVASVCVDIYPHKAAAEAAERHAIKTEKPLHNLRSVPQSVAESPRSQSRNKRGAILSRNGREGIGREWRGELLLISPSIYARQNVTRGSERAVGR